MANAITLEQLSQYQSLLNDGNISGFYSVMLAQGYSYAGWAQGVADGDSIAGLSASEFMTGSAMIGVGGLDGQTLSAGTIQNIKQGMAQAYLDELIDIANDNNDVVSRDIRAEEVWDFHERVFVDNGLSIENWTLHAPFEIERTLNGDTGLENFWELIRDTGGEGLDAFILNGTIWASMGVWAINDWNENVKDLANNWLDNLEETAAIRAIYENLDVIIDDWLTSGLDQASALLSTALLHLSSEATNTSNDDIVEVISSVTNLKLASELVDNIANLIFPSGNSQTAGNVDDLTVSVYGLITNESSPSNLNIESSSSITLSSLANSVAHRYTALNLLPIVISGNDSIYTPYNTNGELEYDAQSDSFWSDRVGLLDAIIERNSEGIGNNSNNSGLHYASVVGEGDYYYEVHMESGESYSILGGGVPDIAAGHQAVDQVIFGSQTSEVDTSKLEGGNKNDRIYGMGGDDLLTGDRGNDKLYGGQGNDTLYAQSDAVRIDRDTDILVGGEGEDQLYGDEGNDILIGGRSLTDVDTDSDTLNGAGGSDTYIAGDGDVISDRYQTARSAGTIYLQDNDNIRLMGGRQQEGSTTQWNGGFGETYIRSGDDLLVDYDDGKQLTIDDYFIEAKYSSVTKHYNYLNITLKSRGDMVVPPPILPFMPAPRRIDPLSLDLDGFGTIETLSISAGVHFDMDNSGFAELTSWVAPTDGLLALDLNGNGYIDGGAELFGTETFLANGEKALHGFEALGEYDENSDGKITAADGIFNDLKVWQDFNSSGTSSAGELHALNELNITEISVDYHVNLFTDENSVEHHEESSFQYGAGETGLTQTLWFQTESANTIPVDIHNGENISTSNEIDGLPDMIGFGNTRSLHEAMQSDASGQLKLLVQNFIQDADPQNRKDSITNILLTWTGQTAVDPESRGAYVNAQHLAVLETFWGQAAEQQNPDRRYGASLTESYADLERSLYSRLMAGSHYYELMSLIDFTEIDGVWHADFSVISTFFADRFENGDADVVADLIDFTYVVGGINPFDVMFDFAFQAALDNAAMQHSTNGMHEFLAYYRQGNDELVGTSNDETIRGFGGSDRIYGHEGLDTLIGGEGIDYIYGGSNDDEIHGGADADFLYGEDGADDLYAEGEGDQLFGGEGGDHYFLDSNALDTRIFDDNYTIHLADLVDDPRSLTKTQLEYRDLIISYGDGSQFTLDNYFSYSSVDLLPNIEFISGSGVPSVISGREITGELMTGTEVGETIIGFSHLANTMNGLGGIDVLTGGDFNDYLDGGEGVDQLSGGKGDDIFVNGEIMYGDEGSDTYRYKNGAGSVAIDNRDYSYNTDYVTGSGHDRLEIEELSLADLQFRREKVGASDLLIMLPNGQDTITIENFWVSNTDVNSATIDEIKLTDSNETIFVEDIEVFVRQGTSGDDFLIGGNNGDTLSGLGGRDYIYGEGGVDTLDGGAGMDIIYGGDGGDSLYGGGNDGGGSRDIIYGEAGDDKLYANEVGNYLLDGGSDNDTFLIGELASEISIETRWSLSDELDVIRYQGNNGKSDFSVSYNTNINGYAYEVVITNDSNGQQLTLEDFFQHTDYQIDFVYFANGEYYTAHDLWSGFYDGENSFHGWEDVDNTIHGYGGIDYLYGGSGYMTGNDTLYGDKGADNLFGLYGDDDLFGGEDNDYLDGGYGNDTLVGGAGHDILNGGYGADTYVYNQSDDTTEIRVSWDHLSHDILKFGEGIKPQDVEVLAKQVSENNSNYMEYKIAVNGNSDAITVSGSYQRLNDGIDEIKFSDGTSWGRQHILDAINNNAPKVNQGIADKTIVEGDPLDYSISLDAFSDLDGDNLTYSATLSDGSALPSWLSFDGSTFSAAPNLVEYGSFQISVNATDGLEVVSTNFELDVLNLVDYYTVYRESDDDGWVYEYHGDGTSGNDYIDIDNIPGNLHGFDGNDTIVLKGTNIYADGGDGDDTFLFDSTTASANIVNITGGAGHDTVKFDFAYSDVTSFSYRRSTYGNLIFEFSGVSDGKVALFNFFEYGSGAKGDRAIEALEFADNQLLDFDDLTAMMLLGDGDSNQIHGLEGNDELYGYGGGDQIWGYEGDDDFYGGTGDDRLFGGTGDNNYYFQKGDGFDTIHSGVFGELLGSNVIKFEGDIKHDDLWFHEVGSHMYVSVLETSDVVNLYRWDYDHHISSIETSEGYSLDLTDQAKFENLVNTMAAFGAPDANGQITISDPENTLNNALAAAWT